MTTAINNLRFLHKAGAKQFFKLLVSAVANAEDKGDVNVDNLIVSRVFVDQGPTLKRWRPRAMGRANRILKKTSHITLEVAEAQHLMGQKTHPIGFRLGVIRTWSSKWFENERYASGCTRTSSCAASSRRSSTPPASPTSRSSAPPTR